MIVQSLTFSDIEGHFQVILQAEPLKVMFRQCSLSKKLETGGVLIGVYSDDFRTANVFEATLPPEDSRRGRDWFERGTQGLRSLLEVRWSGNPRTYYVGEWHFHTANIPWPSEQDILQMCAVAGDPIYHCSNPLLAIVCPAAKSQWIVKLYAFSSKKMPIELILRSSSDMNLI